MKSRNSMRWLSISIEPLEARDLLSAGGFGAAAHSILPQALNTATAALVSLEASTIGSQQSSLISDLKSTPNLNASTVPGNGDVNPYGVAYVPEGIAAHGKLHAGDILVSNFNNSSNLQGTGTTIVDIAPNGKQSLFFQGPSGLGLTTALGVLQRGFVLVGNVPSTDGTSNTVQQGSLLILDKNGNQVANLTDSVKLDGPWDLTVFDQGSQALVFVSNVLNGTVTRLNMTIPESGNHIKVTSSTQIGSGYAHHPDPAALEVGPTGLAYDASTDMLFVASTGDNTIYSIPHAGIRSTSVGKGSVVYHDDNHLRGPLGLVIAPNGHLLTTNGDAVNGDPNHPSELVEFTRSGQFVAQTPIDPTGQGGAFGIAINVDGNDVSFAAVDDITNTLKVWNFDRRRK